MLTKLCSGQGNPDVAVATDQSNIYVALSGYTKTCVHKFCYKFVTQQTRFVDDTNLYINKTNYINFSTIKLPTT